MCYEFYNSLVINSKDRTLGNLNNFQMNKNLNLSGFDYIAVNSFQFTNNIYPINSLNNSLTILVGGNLGIIYATPSNYTINQLVTEVQNQLNGLGFPTTFTVNYNNLSNKITISSTVGNITSISDKLGQVLGFDNPQTGSSLSMIGNNPVNITYTNNMSIVSNEWTKYNNPNSRTDQKVAGIIFNVPIGSLVFGQNFYLEPRHQLYIPWDRTQNINYFDLACYDDNGNLVPMNNSEYILVLNLYKRKI